MPAFSQPLQEYLHCKPSWLGEVAALEVHSTHEHFHTESQRLAQGADTALWLHSYVPTDLSGAGLTSAVLNQIMQDKVGPPQAEPPKVGMRDLDPAIFATLQLTRHSGYSEVVRRTASLFGGAADLSRDNLASCIPVLKERLRPGYYERECRRAGLLSLQTHSFDVAHGECLPVRREQCQPFHHRDLFINGFLTGQCFAVIKAEKAITVDSLETWQAAVERYFADDAERCIAVKCSIAYERRLNFEPTERDEARRAFETLFREGAESQPTSHESGARWTFENYALRFILQLAGRYDLPVKFHTGHYAGPGVRALHRIRDNLVDIEPLLAEFPQVRFIIMHHAYPYGEAAVTLARSYANCFIDQCWAWASNPATTSRYLQEFFTGAPANKIFLFGGDYACLELTLGHLDLARQGLCVTLKRLVDEGWATPEEALQLARRVCQLNQEAVFPQLRQGP